MQATAMSRQPIHEEMPNGPLAPGHILLMLYDGAIRFVDLAKSQIEEGNQTAKEISLAKAYAIIAEFINSLDFEQAPELCTNLQQIYEFMLAQLTEANATMNPKPLEIVHGYLTDMRRTWSEAVSQA